MPEQSRVLLQKDVDAAVKNRRAGALVRFVQRQRQVKRRQAPAMSQAAQGGDQGIVTQTGAAIHFAGAGRDLHDAQ